LVKGGDVNAPNKFGQTALHLASHLAANFAVDNHADMV